MLSLSKIISRSLAVLILLLGFSLACYAAESGYTQCPILAGHLNAHWWRRLAGSEEVVKVTVKRYEGTHGVAQVGATTYEVFKDPVDNKNVANAIQSAWKTIKPENGKKTTPMLYRAKGPNSRWTFVPEGNGGIYQLAPDGNTMKVGEKKCSRNGCLSKGVGPNEEWTNDSDGKVYQEAQPGKPLVQVGWLAWQWITPNDGKRLGTPIPMSKGMGKDAKWCGEQEGVVYVEE